MVGGCAVFLFEVGTGEFEKFVLAFAAGIWYNIGHEH